MSACKRTHGVPELNYAITKDVEPQLADMPFRPFV